MALQNLKKNHYFFQGSLLHLNHQVQDTLDGMGMKIMMIHYLNPPKVFLPWIMMKYIQTTIYN